MCANITDVPVTVFSKGAWSVMSNLGDLPCETLGLDWNMRPDWVRSKVGNEKILQGNLDPCQLYADSKPVAEATKIMLDRFGRGHIANLGHGVYPDTPLDNVKTFVNLQRLGVV